MEGADFTGASIDESTRDQVLSASLPIGSAPRLGETEIRRRIGHHAEWVESLGRSGHRLELEGFDLSGLDLRGANLAAAKLDRCLLARTNLKNAWLLAVSFSGANLCEANLSAADLRGADFRDSHQRGLILPGARTGAIPGLQLATRGLRS